MLRTRIITAAILALVFLAALFGLPTSGWRWFTFVFILIALWEWSRICGFSGATAHVFLGISLVASLWLLYTLSSAPLAAAGVDQLIFSIGMIAASAFWIVIVPLWLKFGWRPENFAILAAAGWMVLFPTWFALIVHRDAGPWNLLGLMALVWIADISAYFAGRAFGRHKLAPGISPGKTWEGVAGAMVGVLVYAWLCIWLMNHVGGGSLAALLPYWPILLVLSLLLVALSVVGDLFESWMKRGAGLKDSSHLLPGHGGVLDRVDALTSTLPVAPVLLLAALRLVSP